MPRILVVLAALVCLVALAAVFILLAMKGPGAKAVQVQAPAAVSQPADPVVETPPAVAPASPPQAKELPAPKPAAVRPKAVAAPQPPPAPVAPTPSPLDARQSLRVGYMTVYRGDGESEQDFATRVEKLRQQVDDSRYRPVAGRMVQMLQQAKGGALKLSEYQKQQVQQMDQEMRDKAKAMLGGMYAQEDELRAQMDALQAQMQQMSRQREGVQQQLNAEFRTKLQGVLTPEQMATIEGGGKYNESKGPAGGAGTATKR